MTGLDPFNDKLIEIAVIITNGHLEPVDEGISYIIKTEKDVLDKWVVLQFRSCSSCCLLRYELARSLRSLSADQVA